MYSRTGARALVTDGFAFLDAESAITFQKFSLFLCEIQLAPDSRVRSRGAHPRKRGARSTVGSLAGASWDSVERAREGHPLPRFNYVCASERASERGRERTRARELGDDAKTRNGITVRDVNGA